MRSQHVDTRVSFARLNLDELALGGSGGGAQVVEAVPELDEDHGRPRVSQHDIRHVAGIGGVAWRLEGRLPASRRGEPDQDLLSGEVTGVLKRRDRVATEADRDGPLERDSDGDPNLQCCSGAVASLEIADLCLAQTYSLAKSGLRQLTAAPGRTRVAAEVRRNR